MDDDEIREYAGDGIVVTWEADRCRHAAECVRGLPATFDTERRPWIDATVSGVEEIVSVVDLCPSYALGYRTADGRTRKAPQAGVDG